MNDKRGKLLGSIFFLLLISWLLYLIFFSQKRNSKGEIEMIEIKGNILLSELDYLTFSKLNDTENINELSLPVIKDRFEKHPYIRKVSLELDGNKISAYITEKKITAVLLGGDDPYYLSEEFEVLPLFPNTKYVDVPVISNPQKADNIKPLLHFRTYDILSAFKILEAFKNVNPVIQKKLSEISLRNGGDIVLIFAGIKAPVIFGKGEEAKKAVYLEMLWEGVVDGKSLLENSDYIDLRFASEIFIGKAEKTGFIK